jgi:protein-S-isoprenylcysteine O-methyltransferase Ste14
MRTAVLLALGALLAVGAGVLIERGTRQAALFAGGTLVLVGLALVALARRQLGAAFAFTPQAKGLVKHGLYSRIPHPMYVFLDLALLGGIVMLRQAWLLGLWVGLVIVQVLQARREARILERVFGDAYREYRRHTWW